MRSCCNFIAVNRAQLEHIIRAAAGNADAREIVIIGSQAILGAWPERLESTPFRTDEERRLALARLARLEPWSRR